MKWNVVIHKSVVAWISGLSDNEKAHVLAAIELLSELGPALGRPLVDTVRSFHMSNLKELRVRNFRLLFAFDPKRTAVVLVGGSKRKRWDSWYTDNVPIAEKRFKAHLREGSEE